MPRRRSLAWRPVMPKLRRKHAAAAIKVLAAIPELRLMSATQKLKMVRLVTQSLKR